MRRNSISLAQKKNILEDISNNISSTEIFQKYNINRSILYKIKQSRENINKFLLQITSKPKKIFRMRQPQFSDLEDKLLQWFLNERNQKNIVNDKKLEFMAQEFAKELKLSNFKASQGYITNFKKRNNIRIKTISGEKLSCDRSKVDIFKDLLLKTMSELNVSSEHIYNVDETALIYKNVDNKTLVANHEKDAPGKKNSKERVTIMACSNATGTHKLNLMMIGKSKSPRIFKNWRPVVYYKSSKNAWQTTALFNEWLNEEFVPSVSKHLKSQGLPLKAVLLMDNASCHMINIDSDELLLKFMYFPPNTTAILQPLDQNVLKCMKMNYRKSLLLSLVTEPEKNTFQKLHDLNLKEVAYLIRQAWEDVTPNLIKSSWKHLINGFYYLLLLIKLSLFLDNNEEITKRSLEDQERQIIDLYRKLVPNDDLLKNTDLIQWADGTSEHELSILKAEKDNYLEPNEYQNIIQMFGEIIKWSEKDNLSIEEIIFLRKIREKVLLKYCI